MENFKKNGLISNDWIEKFHLKVDKIASEVEPYTAARRLVEDEKRNERHRTSVVAVDTTFEVSDLLLTLMFFTNGVLQKNGLPATQFVCAMLSESRDANTYLWMAQQLQNSLGNTANKSVRLVVFKVFIILLSKFLDA